MTVHLHRRRRGAGLSRLMGGIHFRDANRDGLTLGTSVAFNAWSEAETYFTGTAPG